MTEPRRPRRPTSLSLESVCCPDLAGWPGPTERPRVDIRRSQSFHQETKLVEWRDEEARTRPLTTQTEYHPTSIGDDQLQPSASPCSSGGGGGETPEKVDVSVATAGGKIGPERVPRRPVVEIRYTTIDTSYSQGRRKEVSERDTSYSKDSKSKPTTYSDFTLNKSISREPTVNDYSYGCKTKREDTEEDFSLNKRTEARPPTEINYKLASDWVKPTTKYDYRYNWEPTKPSTRYNYSYYRGYQLQTTRYDYNYNTVNQILYQVIM